MNCAQAREAARAVLAEHGVAPVLVDDVPTVVSELVSNALLHGEGLTGLRVTVSAGQVIVEVSDRSTLRPHLRPPSPHTPGGKTIVAPLPLRPAR
ncbi:ATP-binding protein [Streptomyces sp. NPDC127069]|uniref:ATP-binding protein n=1 Tax=Streptomyces sp. NPDC127069 TaxID=3347128 RepID=UPI00364E87AF